MVVVLVTDEFKFPEWTFRQIIQAGDKASNPQSSREFERAGHPHAEAGDPPANSLDAVMDEDRPVELVLSIWDGEHSLSKEEGSVYFGPELKKHIRNLHDDDSRGERLETFDEDMSFLTIEDFNTIGLEGKLDQFRTPYHGISEALRKELNSNRFLWFFRAQNTTSDDQERRGSWGEGKFTLEWASKQRAQITWSRRAESHPRNVLMGQTTVRRHSIISPGEGYGRTNPDGTVEPADFDSYGYFSTWKFGDDPSKYAPLPVTDGTDEGSDYIGSFREKFRMVRQDEPGTSILIPHPRKEITNPDALARALIARWIITFFVGKLEVVIRKNGKLVHEINRETLRDVIASLDWNVEPATIGSTNGKNPSFRTVEQWNALLDLLEAANGLPEDKVFSTDVLGGTSAPTWANPYWDTPNAKEYEDRMKDAFESGGVIKLIGRPIANSKVTGQEEGRFVILLRKSTDEISTTIFARRAMTIPFMDSAKGAVAIVHCMDEDPLAKLLRHAEGPAHLEWNRSADRLKPGSGKWHHGPTTVDFVRDSVKHLLERLKTQEEEEAHSVSIFSITIPSANEGQKKQISGVGEREIPLAKEPDLCRIPSKGSGSNVRIRHNPDLDIRNKKINVNLAYETSKGNSWSKYRAFDFDGSDLDVSASGASMVGSPEVKPTKKDGLVYTFEITSREWKIDFGGFDEIRDVAVDVKRV